MRKRTFVWGARAASLLGSAASRNDLRFRFRFRYWCFRSFVTPQASPRRPSRVKPQTKALDARCR